MKNKIIITAIVFFSVAQTIFAQDTISPAQTFSLKQCVEIAIKNNLQVKESEYQLRTDNVTLLLAKGNALPFVNASIFHGENQGRSIDPFTNSYLNQQILYANYGVNASVTLWNGSAIQNSIKQNKLAYQASAKDLQQQKDDITISVILAYLQVLNNQEILNAATEQASVTAKQAERLASLHKEGATAPANYFDVKGQLAGDEITVTEAKANVETSKILLAQLMNINYSAEMKLETTTGDVPAAMYESGTEEIYEQARKNLALIQAAELRKLSADKGLKAARGAMLPLLSLNGSLGTNYSNAAATNTLISTADQPTDAYVTLDGVKYPVYSPQSSYSSKKISYASQWSNNFNSQVSIGLQIPILNGLQNKGRVQQAKVQQERAAFLNNTVKIQLKQNIDQAYINMQSAFERYQKLTTQLQDYTESFRTIEIRFNAGALTSVDYVIAKNNMDRSQINLIAAKYDYILRTKILDYYQGKLSW
ncbi:MAG TPA: TolC family protein [Chitinophagaceae bacterium]|nr:TolC family protein [Chitinophagaceae bacterium]